MEAYSLFELNQYIKRVMALNFEDAIWIECEISQINEVRGNVYIELIEKSEDTEEIIAKSSASIWMRNKLFIKNKLGAIYDSILSQGIKIKCKVLVEFSERYGFNLNVQDVDPTYTLGQLEIDKQKIIERLKMDGLFGTNKSKPFPPVIQNVAVISSETAAGLADFSKQLLDNAYGYDIRYTLFNAAMQGANTERDVVSAFKAIGEGDKVFDAIVLIRGGGSKIDLSFFDNYNIAAQIAKCALPVIIGIGHEIDQTIVDLVSKLSVRTPTAAAEYLINQSLQYETQILTVHDTILQIAKQSIAEHKVNLAEAGPKLHGFYSEKIQAQQNLLERFMDRLSDLVSYQFKEQYKVLEQQEKILDLMNPKNLLSKGYTMIHQNDTLIKSTKELSKTAFEITFADGKITINQ